MKSTLTSADPSGWYLCEFRGRTYARWWDGESFRRDPCGMRYGTPYVKIRRVITEHDASTIKDVLAAFLNENQRLARFLQNALGDLSNIESPIPVVVEQQPPKVVRVRNRETGKEHRAISATEFAYVLLNDSGSGFCICGKSDWEEVQS